MPLRAPQWRLGWTCRRARCVTVTQTPQRTFTASGGVRITGILRRTAVLDAAEPMDDAWAALLYALALILLFQDDAVV